MDTAAATTLSPPASIPFLTLPNFVRAAGLCDVPIAPILREVGWDPEVMQADRDLIPVEGLECLMRSCTSEARARAPTKHFPFVFGENFGFHALYDLEVFLATCPTARHGVRAFEWFSLFVHPRLTIQLDEGPQTSRFVFLEGADPRVDTHRFIAEASLASMYRISRTMFGGATRARELHLAHEAPAYAALYEQMFPLPLRFGQPQTAVVFDTATLDEPLPGSLRMMHEQAEKRLLQQLQLLPKERGLAVELERAFEECPELLRLSIDTMADRLCTSRRTMQRRLADESSSYTDVQSRVRLRLAKQFLLNNRMSIDDIAEHLGFADRQGLSLAFARWTGKTPAEFRRCGGC